MLSFTQVYTVKTGLGVRGHNVRFYLRLVCPIAAVVDGGGHDDHDGGEKVARHVVVLLPWVFALENLHQHEVELDPLQAHPAEGSQEKEMQNPSDDGAANLQTIDSGEFIRDSITWQLLLLCSQVTLTSTKITRKTVQDQNRESREEGNDVKLWQLARAWVLSSKSDNIIIYWRYKL